MKPVAPEHEGAFAFDDDAVVDRSGAVHQRGRRTRLHGRSSNIADLRERVLHLRRALGQELGSVGRDVDEGIGTGQFIGQRDGVFEANAGARGHVRRGGVHGVADNKTAVTAQKKFATNPLDPGLNQSLALFAVIDGAWLEPSNVERLGRADDWVRFELSYAVEHRLCMVLVGSGDNRHRFDTTPLARSLTGLRTATWFEWRDSLPFDEQLQALTRLLQSRLKAHSRRPSVLRAGARHNEPMGIDIDQAEARYAGTRPAYRRGRYRPDSVLVAVAPGLAPAPRAAPGATQATMTSASPVADPVEAAGQLEAVIEMADAPLAHQQKRATHRCVALVQKASKRVKRGGGAP